MKKVLELIAKELVDHPEEVSVSEEITDGVAVLNLSVAKGDMGKVIGKGGRIANSIRKVLTLIAYREGQNKIVVNIG